MNEDSFRMADIHIKNYDCSVWIPLRGSILNESNNYGVDGFESLFDGFGSIAVPISKRNLVKKLEWFDLGILHDHKSYIKNGKYIPVNIYKNYSGSLIAERLVIDQSINKIEPVEWHLNQDFVVSLGLKREGDIWVCPKEGYIAVVKLHRDAKKNPCLIEVRASFLKDYLCARNMALYLSSYHQRIIVSDNPNLIRLELGRKIENDKKSYFEFRKIEINESGLPFGSSTNVLIAGRSDVNLDEDVPIFDFPNDENTHSESFQIKHTGKKRYRYENEYWKYEWIEPTQFSPIVRGDILPTYIDFITDAQGKKQNIVTLEHSRQWLWFNPDVINALLKNRGSHLQFDTKDTGYISCSPDYSIQFGINKIGLVNVFAKDIVTLPEWQQKIWHGFNIAPDGKVSDELLAFQMECKQVNTQSPEIFLSLGIERLNKEAIEKIGICIIKKHEKFDDILKSTHRFRAIDQSGLLALAKDIARLTADSIDVSAIQQIVKPPKEDKWGSLKSLEKLLATKIAPDLAHKIMGSLFGTYDLRLCDAHLPSSKIDESLKLLKIDSSMPFIFQGYNLLCSCVDSIYKIIDILQKW